MAGSMPYVEKSQGRYQSRFRSDICVSNFLARELDSESTWSIAANLPSLMSQPQSIWTLAKKYRLTNSSPPAKRIGMRGQQASLLRSMKKSVIVMIKKLLSIFRNSSPVNPKPEVTQPVVESSQSEERPLVRWLTKEDPENPFVLEGFDCYGFTSSMLSTTKDQDVARSFLALRSEDGQALRDTLPEDGVEIPCLLSYAFGGETRDGILFKSAVMEEKWDIYLYDNRVYFCRSWTGTLAFVAELAQDDNAFRMSRVWAPGSNDSAMSVRQVDYLVKSHLYKRRVPHPLPDELERDPDVVAMYSFSQYGRLCCFGSYEDTLGSAMLKTDVGNDIAVRAQN